MIETTTKQERITVIHHELSKAFFTKSIFYTSCSADFDEIIASAEQIQILVNPNEVVTTDLTLEFSPTRILQIFQINFLEHETYARFCGQCWKFTDSEKVDEFIRIVKYTIINNCDMSEDC